jgi:hypothetical protein
MLAVTLSAEAVAVIASHYSLARTATNSFHGRACK